MIIISMKRVFFSSSVPCLAQHWTSSLSTFPYCLIIPQISSLLKYCSRSIYNTAVWNNQQNKKVSQYELNLTKRVKKLPRWIRAQIRHAVSSGSSSFMVVAAGRLSGSAAYKHLCNAAQPYQVNKTSPDTSESNDKDRLSGTKELEICRSVRGWNRKITWC